MIITLAQCKSLLNILDTSKDALITALIPEAEAKYLQIRNFPFIQIEADITASDKTVSNVSLYPASALSNIVESNGSTVSCVERMEYVYNSANNIDTYITDIDYDNGTFEIAVASGKTATDVIFTIYPVGSKFVAAKIIQYLMQSNSMTGLQSESVGSYSYSRGSAGNPYGVPDDIFKSIKRYINV